MTDIVTGAVAPFIEDAAHPDRPPQYDPKTSKNAVTVNVPDGTDDCTAEVAIFARYFSDIIDPAGGNPPFRVNANQKQILEDAAKGWVQVIDLRRTKIPSIK